MRVISQKGIEPMVDLPYEQVALEADSCLVLAYFGNMGRKIIARYSTPEKAERAMNRLTEKYENVGQWNSCVGDYPRVFRFPEDSEV